MQMETHDYVNSYLMVTVMLPLSAIILAVKMCINLNMTFEMDQDQIRVHWNVHTRFSRFR